MVSNPGYAAYGDVTTNDNRTAHRPRPGRLDRGAGQGRPAACPAGNDTPEQTSMRTDTTKTFDYAPPIQTGWSEHSAAWATQQLDFAPCRAEQCFRGGL